MNKLIVLSGVPGSGKSYFSNTLKKIKNSHVYVISSDALRKEITGSQSNLSEEKLMWNVDKQVVSNQNLQREFPIAPEVLDIYFSKFELPSERDYEFFDKVIVITNNDIAPVIKELQLDLPQEYLD